MNATQKPVAFLIPSEWQYRAGPHTLPGLLGNVQKNVKKRLVFALHQTSVQMYV
jgi:hypothetical protein